MEARELGRTRVGADENRSHKRSRELEMGAGGWTQREGGTQETGGVGEIAQKSGNEGENQEKRRGWSWRQWTVQSESRAMSWEKG